MSLTKAIAHNTLVQIGGKIISTALGLATIAIMARTLGTEKFGWYATATGFLQFIGILIDFGFTVTTSNMLAMPEFEKGKVFNTIFTWRALTAFIAFFLAPLIFLFFPYNWEIKLAVGLTSLSFFAITISQVLIGYYRQKLELRIVTISEVLSRIVLFSGVAIFAAFGAGFLPIMGMIAAASLCGTLYLIFKFGRIKFGLDKEISKSLSILIWPTALSVIFNSIYLQADRVILPLYVSQTEVGLYIAAYRVLDIVIQIAAITMGMIMPLVTFAWSRNLTNEFRERYQMAVDFLALILLPMIIGIFVLSDPIMMMIGSTEFAEAGIMLKWLSISILGTCFGMTFGHIVLAINKQKQALYIYGSDALLSLIGYFVLIPRFGWQGAVAVTIFSEIYAGLLLAILSIYYSKVFPSLLNLLKITLGSILMGGLVYLLPKVSLPLSVLAGAGFYAIFIIGAGVIKPATLKQVFSFNVAKNS